MDDIPILEVYSRERAADLSAELNLVDRRKLTEEAQPQIKLAHQWLAHGYLRERLLRREGGRAAYAIGFGNPRDCCDRDDSCGSSPSLAARLSRGTPSWVLGIRPVDGFAHLANP